MIIARMQENNCARLIPKQEPIRPYFGVNKKRKQLKTMRKKEKTKNLSKSFSVPRK